MAYDVSTEIEEHKIMCKLRAFLLVTICSLSTEIVFAANVALSPPTLNVLRTFAGWSGQRTFGWQFSSSNIIEISSLGLYDYEENGFQRDHKVGLWDVSSGLLLASVSFDETEAGGVPTGLDIFRWIAL